MAEGTREQVVLDFAARRRPDILLKLPEGEFPIPVDPSVGDMGALFQIEHELSTLLPEYLDLDVKTDEGKDKAVELMNRAQDVVQRLIRLRTPDAPDVRMTPDEILDLIIAYVGRTASEEVLAAISADHDIDAGIDAGIDAAGDGTGGDGVDGEGGGAKTPLARPKRSRKSSSSSGKRTTGRPSGGRKPGGRRSSSTARSSEREPEPVAV